MRKPNLLFQTISYMMLLSLFLGACNMPGRKVATQQGASAIYTAAAETIQAQITQANQPPLMTGAPSETFAVIQGLPATLPSTEIVIASVTPLPPSQTSPPPAPATALPCDLVKFVKDVTIPDNTEFDPGALFTKTWRLQNAGSCTWTSAYGLVFEGDNILNAASFTQLTPGNVAPGATVDVSVNLTAPGAAGTYRQNFKLINGAGQRFALGDGTKPFWAQIKVVLAGGLAFDFITNAALADWMSGAGNEIDTPLVFNGADDDANGAAKIKDAVKLETGAISGKVLLTFPKHEANGAIAGAFPAYIVQAGDRLRGRIGFLANASGVCGAGKATMQIYYIDGGPAKLLSEWNKTCDGSLIPININLGELAGKSVQFIVVVRAGPSFQDDWVIWNSLRIER